MFKLTIRSFIPDNFGQILHIDVWPDDSFSEIIARTCQATEIRCDQKMYFKMENGEIFSLGQFNEKNDVTSILYGELLQLWQKRYTRL